MADHTDIKRNPSAVRRRGDTLGVDGPRTVSLFGVGLRTRSYRRQRGGAQGGGGGGGRGRGGGSGTLGVLGVLGALGGGELGGRVLVRSDLPILVGPLRIDAVLPPLVEVAEGDEG